MLRYVPLIFPGLAGLLFAGCPGNGSDDPLRAVGEPCDIHDECASGLCLTSNAEPVCGLRCDDEDQCPEGSACGLVEVDAAGDEVVPDGGAPSRVVVTACLPENQGGRLFGDACESDDACESGLCHEGLCSELCSECDADRVCEPATLERYAQRVEASICRWDFAAPDITVGPIAVTEAGSEEVLLEIPASLASFTIVVLDHADDMSRWVGILSLVAPDGTVLMSEDDDVADLNQGATNYPGVTTVMVPSTDAPEAFPQAGTYRLRVGLFETDFVEFFPMEGEVDEVRVVFEHAGEEGGLLDLNLFFSPATAITAADAAESEYVRTMLDSALSYFVPFGTVRLGEVRYGEIPSDYDSIDTSDQIREICARFAQPGPHRVSINVFLVGSISFTSGMAGGAPGPPGVVGTPASGVVVETLGNATRTGTVLGHEIGHYLSLHHTTRVSTAGGERRIVGADGISDTPRCEPGTVMEDCPDYRNLMFPYFPFDGLSLTPGQAWVSARYPMLYEINRPGLCALAGSTYDMTGVAFACGDTSVLRDDFDASCGGGGAPDRVQVYRLERAGLDAIEATVSATGFAPVLSVRRRRCDGEEVACGRADAETDLSVTIESPSPDWYFFVVDGVDGGGPFTLEVFEIPSPE